MKDTVKLIIEIPKTEEEIKKKEIQKQTEEYRRVGLLPVESEED